MAVYSCSFPVVLFLWLVAIASAATRTVQHWSLPANVCRPVPSSLCRVAIEHTVDWSNGLAKLAAVFRSSSHLLGPTRGSAAAASP